MSRIGPRELRALGIQVDANGRPTPQAQLQHGVIAQLPPAQPPLPGPPVLGQPAPAVFGQPAGQPAGAVQPQPVPVFGQPAAAAPGASIFGGPPAAGAGAVPPPAGPPAAGLQPPGQPLAGPLPGMGLVQAAINRQPIVWRIPPEMWVEITKYWDALSLLRAVLAEPLIFHSRRFSILAQEPIYQRQWEAGDNRTAPIERFPLLWEAVDGIFPYRMVEILVDLYRNNLLFLNAQWSRRDRTMDRGYHINGGRLQSSIAIRAFETLNTDVLILTLRRGASVATPAKTMQETLKQLWDLGPETALNPQQLYAFEACVCTLIQSGFMTNTIILGAGPMHFMRYGIVKEAAARGMPRVFDACMDAIEQEQWKIYMMLGDFVRFVHFFFNQPAPQLQVLPMIQRLCRTLDFIGPRYNFNANRTGGHVRGPRYDSSPETVRAFILFCALSDRRPWNNVVAWMLSQYGQERCAAFGNTDPFTYLLFPSRNQWDNPQVRAAYEQDMDRLLMGRPGGVAGPLGSNPSLQALQQAAAGPRLNEPLPEINFWQASLRLWPNPLSFALHAWVSRESPRAVTRERSAGLNVAFHLLRRGADPTQVEPGVRQRLVQELYTRQLQNFYYQPVAEPNAQGRTSWDMCNAPGEAIMDYANNPARRAMVVLYFVANNISVVPMGGPFVFY